MEIVWSSLAVEHFDYLLNYIEGQFGALIAQKTLGEILSRINLLSNFPYLGVSDTDFFSVSIGVDVRHLVAPPNLIYYFVDNDKVVIAAIFNSFQSPETIRKTVFNFLEQYK